METTPMTVYRFRTNDLRPTLTHAREARAHYGPVGPGLIVLYNSSGMRLMGNGLPMMIGPNGVPATVAPVNSDQEPEGPIQIHVHPLVELPGLVEAHNSELYVIVLPDGVLAYDLVRTDPPYQDCTELVLGRVSAVMNRGDQ